MYTEEPEAGIISVYNGRYIGPLRLEHLALLKDWRNSQMEILRQWKPLTDYNQEKWYKKVSEDETQAIFSIMTKNKEDCLCFIGYCGIIDINPINKRAEISFLVNPSRANNKELYREDFLSVLYILCQIGFEELNLHKLFTETFSIRKEHIKILEDFGFHKDGSLREHQFIKGKYYDSLIHSILSNEWPTIKKEVKNVFKK